MSNSADSMRYLEVRDHKSQIWKQHKRPATHPSFYSELQTVMSYLKTRYNGLVTASDGLIRFTAIKKKKVSEQTEASN